jgi:hypothetical protein
MKTDDTGGPSAQDKVAERLSRRYSVELERAERDYPALIRPRADPLASGAIPGSGRSLRAWRRIAVPMTVVVALVAVGLVGVGIALRPSAGPTGNNPAPAGVVGGSDGIPTSIDGQRVYRIGDQSEWQKLSGSFLLGGFSIVFAHSCPLQVSPLPSAEHDLVDLCGSGALLAAGPSSDGGPGSLRVAPIGSKALDGWAGGPAIVMRVHTHDPEAAQCAADQKAACEAAVIVDAVVWPTVPTEINGERVYRDTDWASVPTSGSFLLGGPATKPSVMPPCPMQVNQTEAEQKLIPYCYVLSIDGLSVAPMSNLDEPNGEVVVARVHINDPLAAQCPADVRSQCESSVVVESVVWRSTEDAAVASPSSAASTTSPSNPASGEGVGPGASASVASGPSAGSGSASAGSGSVGSVGPLDSDGVPTSIGGVPVYRAVALPTSPTFLLGGPITHDSGCAPTTAAVPPGCGYWMVDGVKVGTMIALPESPSGFAAVVRVEASMSIAVCPDGKSCPPTRGALVVTELVWSGPAMVASPPPASPVPFASATP